MLTTKKELSDRIAALCINLVSKQDIINEIENKIYVQTGIPNAVVNDIITIRVPGLDYEDYILYHILRNISEKEVKKFFTESEIARYGKMVYSPEKLKFPIRIKCNEVQSGMQWIGVISVENLMKFRNARLINYNENTQRPLKIRTINGDEFIGKININESAVDQIMKGYLDGTGIPTTITLNLTEDANYTYNKETGELVIKELSHFDIVDGYHRYVALQRIMLDNKKFDMTMELRITAFSEETARHFIYQEDQKTKMSKLDSMSMNQNDYANQIATRLNQTTISFRGLINNNKATIDYSFLSRTIAAYFTLNNRSDIIKTTDTIGMYLEQIAHDNPEYVDKKWKRSLIIAVIHLISHNASFEGFMDKAEKISKMIHQSDVYKNESSIHSMFTKADANKVDKMCREGGVEYV